MNATVVTGGAGFIGSHLCDTLIGKGNRVICVDNLFTGSERNIKHLFGNKNFRFIRHDIIEPLFLEDEKINKIYNLACPASPVHYQFNAIRTIKANVMGTINMLGMAKKHKARILQASTSEVYGDPKEHPQKETYWGNVNPIGIRSCYDEGKRAAECLFMDYHRQNKVAVCIARIFNTYGPRMARDDGRVVSNFIVQTLAGKPITIYGKGSQTRSFCYVSDMVDGLIKLMESREIGPINLGNPSEFTIIKLAKLVKKLTVSRSEIVFKRLPIDDPVKRRPDIAMAKKLLNWSPKVNLEEGLKKTIEWFRRN